MALLILILSFIKSVNHGHTRRSQSSDIKYLGNALL